MRENYGAVPPPKTGHFSAERPPLRLVTGFVGDRRQVLKPGHAIYGEFAGAWREQDGWTPEQTGAYWRAHLNEWPAVRRSSAEVPAYALRRAQTLGFTRANAARKVLLWPDIDDLRRSLSRRHHGRRIRDLPPEPVHVEGGTAVYEPVISSYVLPRIFAEGEPVPDPNAYCSLPPDFDSRGDDPRVPGIEQRLYTTPKS